MSEKTIDQEAIKKALGIVPNVSEAWYNQFSNQHLHRRDEKAEQQKIEPVRDISKEITANLTKEERQRFQEFIYTRNEQIAGVITELELDRHLYQAYKLGANDISIMTGQPIKIYISSRVFKLSRRILTPEDMTVINARLYGAHNISTHLAAMNDANVAYTIKLSKLPSDIVDTLNKEEREDIVRFRVNITPIGLELQNGQECSLRVIKPDPMTFEQMSVEQMIIDAYQRQTDGLIVICGSTGNGKTSLLSGFMCDMIFSGRDLKIITYEHPIEIRYDKVLTSTDHNVILTQTEIHRHLKSFQDGVVNSLRRFADIAVVGESRDYSTIAASLEFAQTGGLLFTTLHVNNSVGEALYRMVNMFPENERAIKVFEILEAMRLCVIQRLESSKKGGRVAIREILEFSPAIISMLRKEPDLRSMVIKIKELVNTHGISMANSARIKYEEGHLTQDRLEYYERLDSVDIV